MYACYIHVYMYVTLQSLYMYIRTVACLRICTCTYIYMYIYACIYIHVYICTCLWRQIQFPTWGERERERTVLLNPAGASRWQEDHSSSEAPHSRTCPILCIYVHIYICTCTCFIHIYRPISMYYTLHVHICTCVYV